MVSILHSMIMNDDEIRLHAQKHVEDCGYDQYTIGATTHTEGTNVWAVHVHAGEEILFLYINDNDGSLIDLEKQKSIVMNLEEEIPSEDRLAISTSIYFELTVKLRLDVQHTDLESIDLVYDGEFLKAFKICLTNPGKEEYTKAHHLANNFVNYLTVSSGTIVTHKRPLLQLNNVPPRSLQISVNAAHKHGLDEDLLLNMPEQTANAFYYFRMGNAAFQNNSFDQAIGWFYKIIEEDGDPISDYYKPLRNAIDHKNLNRNICKTNEKLKKFNLVLDSNGYLDFNNPDVQFNLRENCYKLHKDAIAKVESMVTELINSK